MAGPAVKTAAPAPERDSGDVIELQTFRVPHPVLETGPGSGYLVGQPVEGGNITGIVEEILASPVGTLVRIRHLDKVTVKSILFTASGYGVLP